MHFYIFIVENLNAENQIVNIDGGVGIKTMTSVSRILYQLKIKFTCFQSSGTKFLILVPEKTVLFFVFF